MEKRENNKIYMLTYNKVILKGIMLIKMVGFYVADKSKLNLNLNALSHSELKRTFSFDI